MPKIRQTMPNKPLKLKHIGSICDLGVWTIGLKALCSDTGRDDFAGANVHHPQHACLDGMDTINA